MLAVPHGQTHSIDANLDLSLDATTTAPARARAAIREWLAHGACDAPLIDTAQLLVSELVTNSLRHAQSTADDPLRIHGRLGDASLRLEVWDGGTQGTVAQHAPRLDVDPGGFGLGLVAELSSHWGVQRDALGTRVWLELPAPPSRPS